MRFQLHSWNQTSVDSQIIFVAHIYHTNCKMGKSINMSRLISENAAACHGQRSDMGFLLHTGSLKLIFPSMQQHDVMKPEGNCYRLLQLPN